MISLAVTFLVVWTLVGVAVLAGLAFSLPQTLRDMKESKAETDEPWRASLWLKDDDEPGVPA